MGIFTRLSDIISSNLHALLDKAENPERMIAQIIREMEQGLESARHCAASAIAAERRIGRELDRNRVEADVWRARAHAALSAGREDLARRALVRKLEHQDLAAGLQKQHVAALETGHGIRASLRALEARLTEARRKQRLLLARHGAAQARDRLERLAGAGAFRTDLPFGKFERLEDRLAEYEEELSIRAEVAQRLDGLEMEFGELAEKQRVEVELDALRQETCAAAGKQ